MTKREKSQSPVWKIATEPVLFHLEDLAATLVSRPGLVPTVAALRGTRWGVGGGGSGVYVGSPSELRQPTAFPSGNASTCFTLTYFFAFPDNQEFEIKTFV